MSNCNEISIRNRRITKKQTNCDNSSNQCKRISPLQFMKKSFRQKTLKLKWTDFEMRRMLKSRNFRTSLIRYEKSRMQTTKTKISKFRILQDSLKIKDQSLKRS